MQPRKQKYLVVTLLLIVIAAVAVVISVASVRRKDPAHVDAGITVVTSFYPMYVAAENVIGDCGEVRLENLSEPQTGCLHDYQLTTEDMKLLSTADVFIVNGGGIESFLTEVAEQYPDLIVVNACEGIDLLEDNPHAWMSLEDYAVQVQNICDGLTAADPDTGHGELYRGNTEEYLGKIRDLMTVESRIAGEVEGRPVVLFNEAYEYLADELGMVVVGVMDLDEERQVSAGEVSQILSVIEKDRVRVIFAEEIYAKEMGDMIEQEADVQVLYLDMLTRGDGDPDSYISGMAENLEKIQLAYN